MRSKGMAALAAVLAIAAFVPIVAAQATTGGGQHHGQIADKVLFFASDGLRQDQVAKYAKQGGVNGFANLLRGGAVASDNGLLTQAPPNTGAGWFTLTTGAWPAVHGSTNNTFHINGTNFANSTAAFGATNVLQAETLAQAAERGGKKVAQIEWAGGRSGAIQGPTLDFRNFRSVRGVVTNYTSPTDIPANITAFGVQYDKADPVAATGWTNVPASDAASPAMEMHMAVKDTLNGTDKYGLNAYIYDSKNDGKKNYDRVLFSRSKDGGADKVADLKEGELGDVKVTIQDTPAGGLNGKTGAMLIKVERLAGDLSQVRLFHTSVTRAIATWPNWTGEPGFTGSFEDYVAEKFPSSQAGDFAVLESGIVSEETYVQQQSYWEKSYQPIIKYVLDKYQPDLALVGYPGTDEIQHQFLGLVTKKLPNGAKNPAYDDIEVNGTPDHRVAQREKFIRDAYEGSSETMEIAQEHMHNKFLDTFVASDHGFAPQFAAIDGSKPLVDLGLLSRPQTSNCRTATGETIGKAKACWAGGALQIYLNVAGRDPVNAAFPQQIQPTEVDATVKKIRDAFEAIQDPNDWTGDGQPEGWDVIDRTFTKAQARYIPNGAKQGQTADMAHPTRTGDLVVFSTPPYQFDAETPGTLIARSQFFGQHGYVPDVQDLASNTNMRATFLAGGTEIKCGKVKDMRSIDIAPTIAFLLDIPAPQQSQGIVRQDVTVLRKQEFRPLSIIGLNDFHGQLEQTNATSDGLNITVGGAPQLATMFDEESASLPGKTLLLAAGDNVGASPPNSALLHDIPAIDVENAWGLDATSFGNHEFDFGIPRIREHEARANFPFLSANIVDAATGEYPDWNKPSQVFKVNGIKVGVIGATVRSTPELVSAGNTAGLAFLDEGDRIKQESERLENQGVDVQIVVIHEGATVGANAIDGQPAVPWDGAIKPIVDKIQPTTVDLVIAGHTHRIANYVQGHIPVVEGVNAGGSYTVAQLMLRGDDVWWAGTQTRVAKNLGVAARPDVQAIVDKANADTAVLRNQVIGTQSIDILRDDTANATHGGADGRARTDESAMGNLVADAMRAKYPGIDASITNSGGLRADLLVTPPTAGEQDGQVTWGEVFGVLPFGNRTAILTLNGAQLKDAFTNGFSAVCNPAINTGRFPQISGLKVTYHCDGLNSVVDGIWKAPNGPAGTLTPVGPADTVRFVTNDFMLTGGDGYTVFTQGTNVQQPGDALLDVTIEYITAHSPVAPVVEGRVVKG
jgi:2',3'-cyclic-nucleotide 2'-phosphodiesterase (5'-nucleotidase family)/predicted AlkP superfamily phosphohydrolase/phosphomutase